MIARCVLALLLFLGIAVSPYVATQATEARPNMLLIVADDLCWRDLGFTGNRDVSTPHPESSDAKARLGLALDAWMAQQGDQGLDTELKAKSRQRRR